MTDCTTMLRSLCQAAKPPLPLAERDPPIRHASFVLSVLALTLSALGFAREAGAQTIDLPPIAIASEAPPAVLRVSSTVGRRFVEIEPRPPEAPRYCPTPCRYDLTPGRYTIRPWGGGIILRPPWTTIEVPAEGLRVRFRERPIRKRRMLTYTMILPGGATVLLGLGLLFGLSTSAATQPYALAGAGVGAAGVVLVIAGLVVDSQVLREPAFEYRDGRVVGRRPGNRHHFAFVVAPVPGGAMAAIAIR